MSKVHLNIENYVWACNQAIRSNGLMLFNKF